MFKAKINVDVLKKCIEVIRAVNDDAVLNISPGGWGINVVDPANVALVSFVLDRYAFSYFAFKPKEASNSCIPHLGEDTIKIGVDFAALDRMLDTVEKVARRVVKGDIPSLNKLKKRRTGIIWHEGFLDEDIKPKQLVSLTIFGGVVYDALAEKEKV